MNTMKSPLFPYQQDIRDVLKSFDVTRDGLDSVASEERLQLYGKNKLRKIHKKPAFLKFFDQFKDLMILLLIASAGIAFYLDDERTGFVLIIIVIINAIIGFSQEYKAERIMESLEKLVVPTANVLRNGEMVSIDASLLVPGDIIFVNEGDSVPADARIIEENELATNDFALTGESNPSRKFTHAIKGSVEIGNRRNIIFMGTTIALGNARCVVTATGMHTELGRIASLSQNQSEGQSPLQKEMTTLAARITIGTLALTAILVAIALGADLAIKDAFLFAIGIASAMIPQGLPAEVNTALSRAASSLAKENALVKKLSAVETLGATEVICTDKTGTLTKNEMTVERILLPDGKIYNVSGTGYDPSGAIHNEDSSELSHQELNHLHRFFLCGYFASNARVNQPDDDHPKWYCIGDPTEGALVTLARKAGINTKAVDENMPELREFPFDSVRKRMSSIRMFNGVPALFVKGAPESILAQCSYIEKPGKSVKKLTSIDKQLALKENDVYAAKAMRNLAYAYRLLNKNEKVEDLKLDEAETDLIYMGMVSLIDPVRDEVSVAMQAARNAHIKVSIITGDYAPTAKAIAVRASLADHPDDLTIIPGDELPILTDARILHLVLGGGVIFSRVSPEDKLRIVNIVKQHGKVVAVTGDGINDAPALKVADIGVAMGVTGTDVAKQSAEIVLLDDSFKTLIDAVQQGRTIFQNIKKATLTCLSSNYAELITILISLALSTTLGIPPAITAIQILAIDLIAELFPIAALGWDQPNRSLMNERPRDPKEHIFNMVAFKDLAFTGTIMGGLAYANFILYLARNNHALTNMDTKSAAYASATTVTYVAICLFQYVNVLIRRSPEPTFSRYLFSNRQLWIALGISFFCVLNIVYNPLMHKVFGTYFIGVIDWLIIHFSAILYFAVREAYKYFQHRKV